MAKTQTRGICQCCAREQAVLAGSGHMSKHGYTVDHGWFTGVCVGQHHKPMQLDRTVADETIRMIRRECEMLDIKANMFESGEIDPETVNTNKYDHKARKFVTIPWADATSYQQSQERARRVSMTRHRAEQGRSVANDIERIADEYHGKELKIVTIDENEGPAPIEINDARLMHGRVIYAADVRKGKVYYSRGTGMTGYVSTVAWRKLPVAPKE